MGLDIFCLPGPPTLLWRDLDALWGYARLTAGKLARRARWGPSGLSRRG